MAKFSQTFLQGLLQPSYQQGLFTAAQRAGQLPGQLQQQQIQQQQMQALRNATPMQRAQYAMQTAQSPAQIAAAQKQMDAAQASIDAGRKAEAVAELNKLYQQYITETNPEKIASLEGRIRSLAPVAGRDVTAVENQLQAIRSRKATQATEEQFQTFFDKYVPDDKKEEWRGLTQAQIQDRLDEMADLEKARDWANWLGKNTITDGNRQEAINLAVQAFGASAAEQVAKAEASQYKKTKEAKEGRKRTLLVTYQGKQEDIEGLSNLFGPAPTKKPTKLEIYLDKEGNVPERILNMLSDTAISAVGQDFDYTWPPKVPQRNVPPPPPTSTVPTLNQLMGR